VLKGTTYNAFDVANSETIRT